MNDDLDISFKQLHLNSEADDDKPVDFNAIKYFLKSKDDDNNFRLMKNKYSKAN